jgi:hypothetical protein
MSFPGYPVLSVQDTEWGPKANIGAAEKKEHLLPVGETNLDSLATS